MAARKTTKTASQPSAPKSVAARKRAVLRDVEEEGSSDEFVEPSYFAAGDSKGNIEFISTGCTVLDEALGGGIAARRVTNVIGDSSTGKTLLATELSANFCAKYPDGEVRYAEAEQAFDDEYAEALGIDLSRVERNAEGTIVGTVEEWHADLERFIKRMKGRPGLYILDSLDAISDDDEIKADFGEASFGGKKPKLISQLFRRMVEPMYTANITLIIVSQTRDKIGVSFGPTKTRSGGRALEFYSSQVVWLAHIGKIDKTIRGIKRVVGHDVRAKVSKNKCGLAHRVVDYSVLYGYGMDDIMSGLEWLKDHAPKALEELGMSVSGYKVSGAAIRNNAERSREFRPLLRKVIRREWSALENEFLPKVRKY